MGNKRYAIVRVDERCPDDFEKIDVRFVCRRTLCYKPNCKNVLYGDTKEQLIKKVQTALQLCNKNRVEKCNQFYFVAKEIVEFLGVKE